MKTTISKMLAILSIASLIATSSCTKSDGPQGPQGIQGNSGPAALYHDYLSIYSGSLTSNYYTLAGNGMQSGDIVIIYVNTDMTGVSWTPLAYKGNVLTSGCNYSFDLYYTIGSFGVTIFNKTAPSPAQQISLRVVLVHTQGMKLKPITDYSYNSIRIQFNLPK